MTAREQSINESGLMLSVSEPVFSQRRSQALSPLPPLSLKEKMGLWSFSQRREREPGDEVGVFKLVFFSLLSYSFRTSSPAGRQKFQKDTFLTQKKHSRTQNLKVQRVTVQKYKGPFVVDVRPDPSG